MDSPKPAHIDTSKTFTPECQIVRVRGAQWFVCARRGNHSGAHKFIPVRPAKVRNGTL